MGMFIKMQSITRNILDTIFLRIGKTRDTLSTKHFKLYTLKFIQILQKHKDQ